MRQFLVLSSSLALILMSFPFEANATPVKEVDKAGIYQPIVDAIKGDLIDSDKKSRQEATTGTVKQTEQQGIISDANNVNAAALEQQSHGVTTHNDYMNAEDAACVLASPGQSLNKAKESAEKALTEALDNRMAVIAGEPGTVCENGAVDCKNKLYETLKSLPVKRLSLGNLLNESTIEKGGETEQQLEFLQNLLYARAPNYLNKDLLENADTETKNSLVESERLKAEMSVGQTIFSMVKSARSPNEDANNGVQFINEHLNANEAESIPTNASYREQLEALTIGMFGKKTMMQSFIDNPENRTIGIMFQIMLSNVLALEQLKYLEAIAVATSTNVIAVREEAIKDVNDRISRKNARQ